MNSPIFIPIHTHHEPDTCPKCKNIENIKQVCGHCGYEYEEEELTTAQHIVAVLFVLFVAWFIITLFMWFMPPFSVDKETWSLWMCIKYQWHWVTSLKII